MRMYDIIKRKRDGEELTDGEIKAVVDGYVRGEIPDYQFSALCMAIYFRGMTVNETTALTMAMRDSGAKMDFSGISGVRVDKHSTGGVGDKTSLIVAPIVASFGVKVAKISGRGLGHTGGTVDKLESISGFRTDLSFSEFESIVNETGLAIIGQSEDVAPADKKIYALRDVTATVDSIPLIASSIMSKKLAADDDCILLDVKTGNGAFLKTLDESRALAEIMIGIGKKAGKRMRALITDMDRPLGNAIGNTLEVQEAVQTLKGNGPSDLTSLCVELSAHMLNLAGLGTLDECRMKAAQAIADGTAYNRFRMMVERQGGDITYIDNPEKFRKAAFTYEVKAERDGYICDVNTEKYGVASLILGAGRKTKDDTVNHAAGIVLIKKTGDYVSSGDVIAVLYTDKSETAEQAAGQILTATAIGDHRPEQKSMVLDVVE